MNDNVYRETFVKTTTDPEYIYKAVCEQHPYEYGWIVGEPKVTNLGNGNYKIEIPLEKHDNLENRIGRSR